MRSDVALELRTLKTVCDGTEKIRGQLLPSLKPEHFSTSVTQGLYRRIIRLHSRDGNIPAWRDLRLDPGVRPDTRKIMREMRKSPFASQTQITSSMSVLDNLRQVRLLYEFGANLEKALNEDAIDPEAIAQKMLSELGKISKYNTDTVVTRIGKGGNAHLKIKNLLTRKTAKFISTGLREFDTKNVGFPSGGVVLLAANTGGGKSTMLDNILEHMAMRGAKIAKLPLEMDAEENLMRDLSRVGDHDLSDLIDPVSRVSKERRKALYKKYVRFQKTMAKRNGFIDIIEPGFDTTMEASLAYCDPFDYDVIAIDYVGLLSGVNGDDQWRALSNALAYAKKWAGRPNKKTLIIIAAQLAADDTLRQSKAMGDHCTNVWHWRIGRDEKDKGFAEIIQDKCRFGDTFSFPIKLDFSKMRFRSLTQAEYDLWIKMQQEKSEAKKGEGGSSWKSGARKKKKQDLPDNDNDEDDEAVKLPSRKIKRRANEY